ncbi:MAG TPA: 3D domain-containing protein, partial [Armatimonadota bacterium]|nr:3D domain-containing protein [Armatimonadota bacterium]
SLLLTLGTTLTLTAQDSPTPKIVTLRVGDTQHQVYTCKETVQTLLHQEFITLGPHDRCEPSLNSPVVNGMTVIVTRISCERRSSRIAIPAPTITRWDTRFSEIPVTLQEGRDGVGEQTIVVWKKNGVTTESWVQGTRVIRKPHPTILLRGNLSSRSGLSVRRVLTMVATAYDPGPLSCGPNCTGRTAMGLIATKGIIAVDPRVIPLGTRVFVDGYGPAIAADTGGAIHGNRIDVCFDSRQEALQWGRRTVKVMIYN